MYSLIFLTAVTICAFWGYRAGVFRVGLRLLALAACYALTWQETPALAAWLAGKGWVNGLLVWPAAGMLLFSGGIVLFGLWANFFARFAPEEWQTGGTISGLLLGTVLGAAIGILAVWTAGTLLDAQRLRQTGSSIGSGQHAALDRADNNPDQRLRELSSGVIASISRKALGDSNIAPLAGELLRAPVSVGERLRELAQKPELKILFQDPHSYAVLLQGTPDDIMQLTAFRSLSHDSELMSFLGSVGLEGSDNPARSRALAEKLSTIARNVERVRNTDEFKMLSADKEITQLVEQGNFLMLMTHDKVRTLAQTLFTSDGSKTSAPATGSPTLAPRQPAAQPQPNTEKLPQKPVYRWQDSNKRWHYSEQKPPEGTAFEEVPLGK